MANPDVYEILNRLQTPDAQVIRQSIENLKTERDFERRERLRLDDLRSELVFAFGFQVEELRKKRDEWQATAEKLSEFVIDEADNDCHYGDNCPSNAGTRHGTCRSCKARQTLAACGIHVWFEHDDLEACRNCGVARRANDGNKPCGEEGVTPCLIL